MDLNIIYTFFSTGTFDPTHPTIAQVLSKNFGLIFISIVFLIAIEIGRFGLGLKIFGKEKAYKAIIPVYGLMQLFRLISLNPWLALICYVPIIGLIPFAIFCFLLPKAFSAPLPLQITGIFLPWIVFNILGFNKKYEFQYAKGKNVAFKDEFRTVMPEEIAANNSSFANNDTSTTDPLLANASMVSRAASAAAEQTEAMLKQKEATELEAMQKKQAEEAAKKIEKHKAEDFKYDIFDNTKNPEKESSALDFEFNIVNGRFQSAPVQPNLTQVNNVTEQTLNEVGHNES